MNQYHWHYWVCDKGHPDSFQRDTDEGLIWFGPNVCIYGCGIDLELAREYPLLEIIQESQP